MTMKDEIREKILKKYNSTEDLIGKDGIFKKLTKRLIEKAWTNERFK